MTSRYYNREIKANFSSKYKSFFKERNINFIDQYSTPNKVPLNEEDYEKLFTVPHIWSHGDRFYKLADEYYGDSTLWWIIAWFNHLPTEAHVKNGWAVDIPLPFESVLELWDK